MHQRMAKIGTGMPGTPGQLDKTVAGDIKPLNSGRVWLGLGPRRRHRQPPTLALQGTQALGAALVPGNPIKMSGSRGSISRPAPLLGEHTDAVLGRLLKLTPETIMGLRKSKAIG